jgi:hypothetical protein
MQRLDTIHTDTWSIALPVDWVERGETEEGALYFESADGTKGLYISTWDLEEAEPQTSLEIAESFKQAGLNSLLTMDGYSWRTITDETVQAGESAVVLIDSIAEEKNYRIAGKIVASMPIVIRAAFHDYACVDHDASVEYFAPIIASLRILEENDQEESNQNDS